MLNLSVFDLDKTLACCNVSFAFGRFLYKRGVLSFFSMLPIVVTYWLQKVGLCSIHTLHSTAFRRLFYQKDYEDIERYTRDFLQQNRDLLFRPWMVEVLENARARGERIWIQSSSPDFLVEPIAKYLGVQHFTGSSYVRAHDGKFSHILHIIDGHAKKALLGEFLLANSLRSEDVTAYSDSYLDLPLLESVGQAIVVCPEKRLRAIAVARNWQILE